MKILLTGVAGFIGYHTANRLLQKKNEIIGVDNLNSYYDVDLKKKRQTILEKSSNFKVFNDSLENDQFLEKLFKQFNPRVVIHLAAQAGVRYSFENPKSYVSSNILGTFNILEASLNNNNLKHLVVTSTDGTIPKYPKKRLEYPIAEFDLPQNATDWYGYSKTLAENLSRRYFDSDRLPVSVLRFSMVFGRLEVCKWSQFYTGHFLNSFEGKTEFSDTYNKLLEHVSNGENLIIPRDNGVSWKKHVIDIRDIIHAYDAMMCNQNTFGKTYQIAGPQSFEWSEVIPVLSKKNLI